MMKRKTMTQAGIRFAKGLAIGGIAIGVAVGCSSDDPTRHIGGERAPAQSERLQEEAGEIDGEHNEADITFNQGMIPHHRQAIAMTELVPDRTDNQEIIDLAAQIRSEQQSELETMIARLEAWGAAVPAETVGDENPDDAPDTDENIDEDTGHHPDGMLSGEQMAELAGASGRQFERLWLTGMIAHHEGAISMADTELADGVNDPSRALAELIKDEQWREIDDMKNLLEELEDEHGGEW